jgi:hypothetical protein
MGAGDRGGGGVSGRREGARAAGDVCTDGSIASILDDRIDAVVAQLRRGARGRAAPASGDAASGRAARELEALAEALSGGDMCSCPSAGALSALLACLRSADAGAVQVVLRCVCELAGGRKWVVGGRGAL